MAKIRNQRTGRVVQGDIIRDVDHIEYVSVKGGIVEVSTIVFPLIVVLTQDCDLEQDFKFRWGRAKKPATQDKYLLSVLVAPLYNLEHVYAGEHLSAVGLTMQTINKKVTKADTSRTMNVRGTTTSLFHRAFRSSRRSWTLSITSR